MKCFLSTTLFFCGRSTQENWCRTHFFKKKSEKASSFALSDLNLLMVVLNWVSTYEKICGTIRRQSDLFIRKYIQVNLLLSSTKVKKYLNPSKVTSLKGPQMSACIKSNNSALKLFWLVKANLFCLAMGQTSQ